MEKKEFIEPEMEFVKLNADVLTDSGISLVPEESDFDIYAE